MRKKDRIEMVELRTKVLELERELASTKSDRDVARQQRDDERAKISKVREAVGSDYGLRWDIGGAGGAGDVLMKV